VIGACARRMAGEKTIEAVVAVPRPTRKVRRFIAASSREILTFLSG
jgi:hypothetical protein